MSLVGPLLFCTACGNLLEFFAPSEKKVIVCEICEETNTNKWPTSSQITSKPNTFPSALRQKRGKIQAIDVDEIETWAKVTQDCPECNNPDLLFRDMQLRGADEGSTIFYRCPKCNYRTKVEN